MDWERVSSARWRLLPSPDLCGHGFGTRPTRPHQRPDESTQATAGTQGRRLHAAEPVGACRDLATGRGPSCGKESGGIGMRKYIGAVALAAVALTVVLIGSASAKPPAPPAVANGCPNGGPISSTPRSALISRAQRPGHTPSRRGKTRTRSTECRVSSGTASYTNQTARHCHTRCTTRGRPPERRNFDLLVHATEAARRATSRSTGRPTLEVGTATFATAPTTQTILLHVSDAADLQDSLRRRRDHLLRPSEAEAGAVLRHDHGQ